MRLWGGGGGVGGGGGEMCVFILNAAYILIFVFVNVKNQWLKTAQPTFAIFRNMPDILFCYLED